MWELGTHGRWISTRNRAPMEKSFLLLQVESMYEATGYPLRIPRLLEDTVLDAHTREPTTVITERYLGVLCFCRWSQPGHNQKLAHIISEIRVERSHSMFCTNCHKIDIITTGYCSWAEIHPYKKKQYNLVCFTDTGYSAFFIGTTDRYYYC